MRPTTMRRNKLGAPAPSGPAVSDDFSEADGTSLSGKATDTGQSWVQTSGTWTVQTQKAKCVAVAANQIVQVESGLADCTVSATIVWGEQYPGLTFRFVDASNFWLCLFNSSNTAIQLSKFVAGAQTVVATAACTASPLMKVELSGSTIKAYIDGALLTTVTDSAHQTATKHGLFAYGTGTSTWDDFSVTA